MRDGEKGLSAPQLTGTGALGSLPLANCPACDSTNDGVVTVDELITAVNNALSGCPVRVG
jgi:hypothetical protein